MTVSDSILAAIIAGTVALTVALLSQVVAIVNQILSHRLAQQRETQKYYNEVYQKLFIPAIPSLFLFIDMVSNVRRRHDTTLGQEIEVKNRVLDHVGENLLYASPRLVHAYQAIQRLQIHDESGYNPSSAELRFLLSFVNEYDYVIRHTSIYVGKEQNEQLDTIVRYRTLYLFLCNRLEILVTYCFYFDNSALNQKTYTKIEKLVQERDSHNEKAFRKRESYIRQIEKTAQDKPREEQAPIFNDVMQKYDEKQKTLHTDYYRRNLKSILRILIKDEHNRASVFDAAIEAIGSPYSDTFWAPDDTSWQNSDTFLSSSPPEAVSDDEALG